MHVMVRGHLRELVLFQDVSSKDPNQHFYLPRHLPTISPPFILAYIFTFVSVFGLVLLGIKAKTIDLYL